MDFNSPLSEAIVVMISDIRNKRKENDLIEDKISISDGETKTPKTYQLLSADFNEVRRTANISFLETYKYKTVLRYVQRNYQKYPVYSDFKTHERRFTLNISLRNYDLENLPNNDNELIAEFAHEIVYNISRPDLYPSWFLKDAINKKYDDISKETIDGYKPFFDQKIKDLNEKKKTLYFDQCSFENINKKIYKTDSHISRNIRFIDKANERNNSFLYSLLTLGIWLIFHSKSWVNILKKNLLKLNKKKNNLEKERSEIIKKMETDKKEINSIEQDIKDKEKEKNYDLSLIAKEREKKLSKIVSLVTYVDIAMDGFVPLKQFVGMEKEKLIGVYIIRNNKLNKYYVGQSKNIFKRICGQHFNGLIPKNPNFTEDYYSTPYNERENLFSVKVIPLETKDKLDKTEADMIAFYHARENGYNKTVGNS